VRDGSAEFQKSSSVADVAAECSFLLTKQQLVNRSVSGTCCITSLRTSSGSDVRLGMTKRVKDVGSQSALPIKGDLLYTRSRKTLGKRDGLDLMRTFL
jgi:hypothetical protein